MVKRKSAQVRRVKIPERSNSKHGHGCLIGLLIILFLIFGWIVIVYFAIIRQIPTSNQDRSESTRYPSATPIPTISREALLNYFTDIANHQSGSNDQASTLIRWVKTPVTVELLGDVNDDVITTTDSIITAFNSLSQTIKLVRVESEGDLKIHFVPEAEMLNKRKGKSQDIFGWANPHTDNQCQIQYAEIYLKNQVKDHQVVLHSTLVHEIGHTLGFTGHDYARIGCNALTNIACAPIETYNAYDTFAIQALYNSGVPICSNEQQARTYLTDHSPDY